MIDLRLARLEKARELLTQNLEAAQNAPAADGDAPQTENNPEAEVWPQAIAPLPAVQRLKPHGERRSRVVRTTRSRHPLDERSALANAIPEKPVFVRAGEVRIAAAPPPPKPVTAPPAEGTLDSLIRDLKHHAHDRHNGAGQH